MRMVIVALVAFVILAVLPLGVSGYILGLLTLAYYFGVFAMSWDLLFGFAGEVNFGPTFLIGLGAYGAGLLNSPKYGPSRPASRAARRWRSWVGCCLRCLRCGCAGHISGWSRWSR